MYLTFCYIRSYRHKEFYYYRNLGLRDTILWGLECRTGRITGLLGRNGQGKTCLMRAIYGDLACTSRSIRLDDTAIPQSYRRPDLVRYLPQFNFISGSLTLKRVFTDFNLERHELVTDHLYRDVLDISDDLYVLSDGTTRPANGTKDLETFGYISASGPTDASNNYTVYS